MSTFLMKVFVFGVSVCFALCGVTLCAQTPPTSGTFRSNAAPELRVHSYGFTWRALPSGGIGAIRLEIQPNGTGRLTTKVTDTWDKVIVDKAEDISRPNVESFLELVRDSEFWSLPSKEAEEGPRTKDGTGFGIEGTRDGIYHEVYRRSPKPSSFTELARFLAKNLAHLEDSVLFIPKFQ